MSIRLECVRRLFAAAALAAVATACLHADTTYSVATNAASGVTVRLTTPFQNQPHFGFLPVRVLVENNSQRDGEWQFRFQAGQSGLGTSRVSSETKVAVPAGQTRESWFYVPIAEAGVPLTYSNTSGLAGGMGGMSTVPPPIAGVYPAPPGVRSNVRIANAAPTPSPSGMVVERTFIINQTGPAALLPVIPQAQLPPRTTMAITAPNVSGDITRTTTVVVQEAMSSFGRGGRLNPSNVDPAARSALAASGLLNIGSATQITLGPFMFYSQGGGGPPLVIVVFQQTGTTSDLPEIGASRIPPGVMVNFHASNVPGQVIRTVSYVEPTELGAFMTTAIPSRQGATTNFLTDVARIELVRRGFATGQSGIQLTSTSRDPSGLTQTRTYTAVGVGSGRGGGGRGGGGSSGPPASSGTTSNTTIIFSESGPSALLPQPTPKSMPPNVTVNVVPGALPGEVVRNFISSISPAMLPSAPATGRVFGTQNIDIAATVSGPGIAAPGVVSLSAALSNGVGSTFPLAVATALDSDVRSLFTASLIRGTINLTSVDATSVPADWRQWVAYHGVVMRAADYASLDAGRRTALLGWVGLGGNLFLEPDTAGPAHVSRFGAGTIRTLPASIPDIPNSDAIDAFQLDTLAPTVPDRGNLALKDTPLGNEIPDDGFASRWLIIFLIGFAILSGPVNLLYFARNSTRHRLFWTTPVLAIAGSVALVLTILLEDGFGGVGRRSALVVILPGLNQAAVFQEQAAKTGFLSKRSFALDDDVVMAPIDGDAGTRGLSDGNQLSRNAAQADGDWFRTRARQAHLLRRVVPTRSRVDLVGTAPNGAPIVESSLATLLKGFMYCDASGRFWTTSEIGPGKRVTLAQSPAVAKLTTRGLGGTKAFKEIEDRVSEPLPGHWFGWGGDTEIAPLKTLASIEWREGLVAYTGVAEAPATGGAR